MKYLILIFAFVAIANAQSFSPGIPLPGLPKSLGPKTPAQSTSVVVANSSITVTSNGSLSVSANGKNPVLPYVNLNYAANSVLSTTATQLITGTASGINAVEIFDSSGRTLYLTVSPTRKIVITPGGNGLVPFYIPAGSNIYIQSTVGNATSGELDINFYD